MNKSKLITVVSALMLGVIFVLTAMMILVLTGIIQLNRINLTFSTESREEVYTGMPLTNHQWKLLSGSLKKGHEIQCKVTGSQNGVGESKNMMEIVIVDELEAVNNPEDESAGKRVVPFTKRIYIERTDFMENPPKKFFRLTPDNEVRLRYAYLMRCKEVIKDSDGNIVKLICTIDPASRGGNSPDGRKVKGTIHWVSAEKSLKAKAMLYSTLFTREDMSVLPEGSDFKDFLNPESLVEKDIFIEPSLKDAKAGEPLQFERIAYFMADSKLSTPEYPVFNRTVELKDSYGK